MKELAIATGAFIMMMTAMVNGDGVKPGNENTYCAEMKDSVLVVMRDGKQLTQDIIFENGTEIKTDGRVIYPDGLKATLKAGECVDKTGVIITAKTGRN